MSSGGPPSSGTDATRFSSWTSATTPGALCSATARSSASCTRSCLAFAELVMVHSW
ncbi:hypothetical protein [Streptosporangium canum]|uniref:hypothetical protein n=1 Tax=Streptosporangium canum TaxID=324952 RepID=UPI0037A014C7